MHTIQVGKGWFPEESGGLNRYYRDLVGKLPEAGVGVTGLVAASNAAATNSAGAVRSFAPRESSLAWRLGSVRRRTREALAAHPGAVVAAHFALYAAPALDLLDRASFVAHFHGPWGPEAGAEGAGRLVVALKSAVEGKVYRRAARVVTLSRAFARLLETRYRVPPERIRVVPGGVDADRFRPTMSRTAARATLGWPTDRPIALVVRRLVRRMGLGRLLDAVSVARKREPDLLVVIAGRGLLEAELARRIEAESLGRWVRLAGFVPDDRLPLAYRAADLTVVPSVSLEGFGLVVAESLSAGTPALVTAVDGLPETIEDLAPDWVVARADGDELGEALAAATGGRLAAPSEEACRRHAKERFDWGVVTRRIRAVYDEVG